MARRPFALFAACAVAGAAMLVAFTIPSEVAGASKSTKKPIRNPKFDPKAEQIDLFEAVDAKQVTVKLIPTDEKSGTVLIENKTDKPLTVKVPDAVVGVSIHSQFGGMGGGGMGGGGMGGGGMGGGGMGGGGGQAMGGGMGGGGMGGGMGGGGMGGGGMGGMGGGGGFFSIPAEKVVSIPFKSVCLEHGKPEPTSSDRYTLIPVARFTKSRQVYHLLAAVGTGKVDQQAAQAAAWHLTNDMSFSDLANKTQEHLGAAEPSPYFTREELLGAQQLVAYSSVKVAEEEEAADKKPETPIKTAPTSRVPGK